MNGKIVASGAVETYPLRLPMSLRSRLALLRAGIKLRLAVRRYSKIAKPRAGEDASGRQIRMLAFRDDQSFADFVGSLPPDVDSILRCTLTRSSGEPEELAAGYGIGYFHLVWNRAAGLSRGILGGPTSIIDGLASSLNGIQLNAVVNSVVHEGGGVRVRYTSGGQAHTVRARFAVVATPAYVAHQIIGGLPQDTAHALTQIPYGPYVVGAILTTQDRAMPCGPPLCACHPGVLVLDALQHRQCRVR